MMKIICVATTILVLLCGHGSAQELSGVPMGVESPGDLANWLLSRFQYKVEVPDRWQSPQETIDKGYGDCEDFAVLSSRILEEKFNLKNDIVIVEFEGMNLAHLICVWKNEDGTYSFMSNNKIHNTKKEYLSDAIRRYYPDCSTYKIANRMKTAYRYFYKSR